jgi:hypothetical protein
MLDTSSDGYVVPEEVDPSLVILENGEDSGPISIPGNNEGYGSVSYVVTTGDGTPVGRIFTYKGRVWLGNDKTYETVMLPYLQIKDFGKTYTHAALFGEDLNLLARRHFSVLVDSANGASSGFVIKDAGSGEGTGYKKEDFEGVER